MARRRDRIRSIKPEIRRSKSLSRCSRDARLTFVLLITLADDEGRFEADEELLRTDLYPRDPSITEQEVSRWLDELSRNGMLRLFEVDGSRFGQVANWHHQRIDRPSPSELPKPEDGEVFQYETLPFDEGSTIDRSRVRAGAHPSDQDLDLDLDLERDQDHLTAKAVLSGRIATPTEQVFRAWADSLGGATRSLTKARKAKIAARLKVFPLDDVIDAVQGWQNDPWSDRVNQNDVTQLLRSDEQCEKFRDLWRNGAPQSNAPSTNPVSREIQGFTAFADAEARGEF